MAAALLATGCARTHYLPQVVARGELVLQQADRLEMWAGHRRVARSLDWRGLDSFVRCVPEAQKHAQQARRNGRASRALAFLGGSLGVVSLGSLAGFADQPHVAAWLSAGVGVAGLGVIFAGVSRLLRNTANGHAVDALNFYNDAVGSLGATCDDLTYPPSSGAAAPMPTSR